MPWWRFWQPETEEEKALALREKQNIEALERGELPFGARERAENFRKALEGGKTFFSSDLSVREFLLTKDIGVEPISQVMGTSFFNVSFWGSYMGPYRSTGELLRVTHAQTEARRVAVDRMLAEAKLLNASGVVGVRVVSRPSRMGNRISEFIAYGTAVRIPGHPPSEEPFTCALDGQDFWQLYKAGYRPKGVVMGLCSYYLWTNWSAAWQMGNSFLGLGGMKNQEIDQYQSGFNSARQLAVGRLTHELNLLKADGCVGMSINHEIEHIEYDSNNSRQIDLLVHFSALGTAVDSVAAYTPQPKLLCLDVSKGRGSGFAAEFQERYQGVQVTSGITGGDDDDFDDE